jgi:hypothetical protein
MSSSSRYDLSQFQDSLIKLSRDKSSVSNNSKIIEKRANQGGVVVLKGSLRLILILYGIFFVVIIGIHLIWIFGLSFFDFHRGNGEKNE